MSEGTLPNGWTRDDILCLLEQLEHGPILVSDANLRIPTIHDLTQNAAHLGWGLFEVKTPAYTIQFCAGGQMERTPSGNGWTRVTVVQGDFPYDAEAVRKMLTGWLESETTTPLLPDGRPRAPLPVFLVEHLCPEHTLKFYSDEAHPLYADDLLVIMGTHLVTGQWSWAAHYDKGDNSNTPWPINLWNTSGSEIVGGDTAGMAVQALQEHLWAWGFKTHIILDDKPEKEKPKDGSPISPAPQAAPKPTKASKPLPDGVPVTLPIKMS